MDENLIVIEGTKAVVGEGRDVMWLQTTEVETEMTGVIC